MEETKKRVLALPPNYVTLQQLREQRLKEQQQKQREKEEEEEEEERRRLEAQRLKEEREKMKKKEKEEERSRLQIIKESKTIKVGSASFDRPYRRNHQKYTQNPNVGIIETVVPIKKEQEIIVAAGGEEIEDPEAKLEDMKEKKKRKKWKKNKKRKLKEEENLIGDLENVPELEDNQDETIPELNHEKPAGKMNTRNGFRRWGRKSSSEEVNKTVEIAPEVSHENNRNGFRRSEKRSPSEQDYVSVNQKVEIEAEISHEKSAGRMNTRKGIRRWEKRPPSEHDEISNPINPNVEIDPDVLPEKAAGNVKTRNGFRRRNSRQPSEEESKNPTDEIERKIGDLTVGDDKKRFTRTTNDEKNSGYTNRINPRRFGGYRGKTFDATLMWVRKDEKETDRISG